MAKEKFERTKPHVNVGTSGHIQQIEGPAGLTVETAESTTGNPGESYLVSVAGDGTETTSVLVPLDEEFFFRPDTGPAVSLDFSIDVLPIVVQGTTDVDVSLGILQGEFYLARASSTFDAPSITGPDAEWATLAAQSLTAGDFEEADGGLGQPDFARPFQFGYALTSQTSTAPLNLELGLDNMTVEITTIPEPTSIALAISMGAALLWSRWWDSEE